MLVSPFLLRELERVLSYERVRRVTRLTDDEAAEFLFFLGRPGISETIYPGAAPRVVPADEDDDPIVHTAVVGRADAICTLNHHFYDSFVIEYSRSHGVLVANDVELRRLLRS